MQGAESQLQCDSLWISSKYETIKSQNLSYPKYSIFLNGLRGFCRLSEKGLIDKNIITLIDFRAPSTERRLWVIDLDSSEVLFNTYVAHGKNTGIKFARKFSNRPKSNMSSLGFYCTGTTYYGKHGLSLYLNGLEKEFNLKARQRTIVLHGAHYVSKEFIRKYGRLGRSFGCPAVPMGKHKDIINAIKEGSCLFIYYPEPQYITKSYLIRPLKKS